MQGSNDESNAHYGFFCLISVVKLTRANAGLRGLAPSSTTVIHLTLDFRIGAYVLEGRGVTVVGVDTGKFTTVNGSYALDVDVPLALLGALFGRH